MCALILLLSLLLVACSTDQKTLLPVDENTTMLNIRGRQNGDKQALIKKPQKSSTTRLTVTCFRRDPA